MFKTIITLKDKKKTKRGKRKDTRSFMTEHEWMNEWIQRIADYLRLIKDVILKQSLPAVLTWIREWKRERKAGR